MVRRNGSFIYEEFLATGGTDVKVRAPPASTCTYPDSPTVRLYLSCSAAHTQHSIMSSNYAYDWTPSDCMPDSLQTL